MALYTHTRSRVFTDGTGARTVSPLSKCTRLFGAIPGKGCEFPYRESTTAICDPDSPYGSPSEGSQARAEVARVKGIRP